jgi:NADH dehydrogenase
LAAARALRRAPVRVTLLDRRNHHLFQPLLYQVATGGLSPGEIAYPIRAVVRNQKNTQVLLAEATGIDLKRRQVRLADGVLGYDALILAAGARHSYFGHPEWEPLAPGLKDVEDALEIRRRILLAFERAEREPDPERRRAELTFAIVGGGPPGVELAGAIADIARRVLVEDFREIDPRDTRVLLLEAGLRLLPAFPILLSAKAEDALRELGVEVRTSTLVTGVSEDHVEVDGEPIPARTILWAAGVRASSLAATLGLPLDRAGRVEVEPDLTLPGHPEVAIIGDLARLRDRDGRWLPGLAPVAMQQGRAAAANIASAVKGAPRRPFRYVDKGNLAAIGRARAVADIHGLQLSGLPAWLVWLFVHILFLIGFRNRVLVSMEWTWDYLSFQQAARLITGRIEWPGEAEDEQEAASA